MSLKISSRPYRVNISISVRASQTEIKVSGYGFKSQISVSGRALVSEFSVSSRAYKNRISINSRRYLLTAEESGTVERITINCMVVAREITRILKKANLWDKGYHPRVYHRDDFVTLKQDKETDEVFIVPSDECEQNSELLQVAIKTAERFNKEKSYLLLCSPNFPDGVPRHFLPHSILLTEDERVSFSLFQACDYVKGSNNGIVAPDFDETPEEKIRWYCDEWDSQRMEVSKLSDSLIVGMILKKIRNTRPGDKFSAQDISIQIKRFWSCQDDDRAKDIKSQYREVIDFCINMGIVELDKSTWTITSICPSKIPVKGNRIDVALFLRKASRYPKKKVVAKTA